jgi:hypothetical protein
VVVVVDEPTDAGTSGVVVDVVVRGSEVVVGGGFVVVVVGDFVVVVVGGFVVVVVGGFVVVVDGFGTRVVVVVVAASAPAAPSTPSRGPHTTTAMPAKATVFG